MDILHAHGYSKKITQSEKMGDIKDQLSILSQMLPYFHAAGHSLYKMSSCLHSKNDRIHWETDSDVKLQFQ